MSRNKHEHNLDRKRQLQAFNTSHSKKTQTKTKQTKKVAYILYFLFS